MPTSPIEYITAECPNRHRVRGDAGWLNRDVRCPHCGAEFTFRRPDAAASEVVAAGGRRIDKPSVSDTGVMRILGDYSSLPTSNDGSSRRCPQCAANYPSDVQTCYSCNVPLGRPHPAEASQESPPVFQDVDSFPFRDDPVTKVMRPRKEIDHLDVSTPLEKILNRIQTTAHTHYPVCDGSLEDLVGLAHVEDIILSEPSEFSIRKIVRPMDVLPSTTPVSEAIRRLQKCGEPIALIADEYETVIGMVTIKDMLRKLVMRQS